MSQMSIPGMKNPGMLRLGSWLATATEHPEGETDDKFKRPRDA
jgi:hypothetical protein